MLALALKPEGMGTFAFAETAGRVGMGVEEDTEVEEQDEGWGVALVGLVEGEEDCWRWGEESEFLRTDHHLGKKNLRKCSKLVF